MDSFTLSVVGLVFAPAKLLNGARHNFLILSASTHSLEMVLVLVYQKYLDNDQNRSLSKLFLFKTAHKRFLKMFS